jgi:hypothetical protein
VALHYGEMMAEKSIAQKLQIKDGYQCLVLNSPPSYMARLSEPPDGATIAYVPKSGDKYDLVQLFVRSTTELGETFDDAVHTLRVGGVLWICYPKRSGGIKTDLRRDQGFDLVYQRGFEFVTLVSIDETWSAMRFRPSTENKRKSG